MTKRSSIPAIPRSAATLWLAALVLLGLLSPARANIFKKVKKGVSSATHEVEHTADKAVDATKKTADKAVDATKKTADKAVDATQKTADKAVDATAKTASDAWRKTRRAFSDDEMAKLDALAKRSYQQGIDGIESGYRAAVAEAKSLYNQAEEAALRSAAQRYLDKFEGFLGKLDANIGGLAGDADAQALLKRVMSAAAERRVDAQTRDDMQRLADRLGLIAGRPNSIVPGPNGGSFRSSWGFAFGAHVGTVVGATGLIGLTGACYTEPGQGYAIAPFAAPSVTLGYQAGSVFNAQVVFFWQPGSPDEGQGLWVGLTSSYAARTKAPLTAPAPGFQAATGFSTGGTVGVRWKVLGDKGHLTWPKGALAAVPGFYLGGTVSYGGGASAGLEVYHMWVLSPSQARGVQAGAAGGGK